MSGHPFAIEIVGLVAAALTTSSFVPQALKIWRSRSAADVSFVMYLMMSLGTALWLIYGVLLDSLALMVANGTAFVLVTSVLVLKIRHR